MDSSDVRPALSDIPLCGLIQWMTRIIRWFFFFFPTHSSVHPAAHLWWMVPDDDVGCGSSRPHHLRLPHLPHPALFFSFKKRGANDLWAWQKQSFVFPRHMWTNKLYAFLREKKMNCFWGERRRRKKMPPAGRESVNHAAG